MAIIDAALWQQVQPRLAERATAAGTSRRVGQRPGRRYPDESSYLLVGFARCGICRGPIGTDLRAHGSAGHRQHKPHYACLDHMKRGNAVCGNAVGLSQARLDRAVLDAIARALDPSVVEIAIDKALAALTSADRARAARRAHLERETAQVQARIDRLVTALADTALPADEIRPRLCRRQSLQDRAAQ